MDANPNRDNQDLVLSKNDYAELADIAYVSDCLNMAFESFSLEISDYKSADAFKHLLSDITSRLYYLVSQLDDQLPYGHPSDSSIKAQNPLIARPTPEEIEAVKNEMIKLAEKKQD